MNMMLPFLFISKLVKPGVLTLGANIYVLPFAHSGRRHGGEFPIGTRVRLNSKRSTIVGQWATVRHNGETGQWFKDKGGQKEGKDWQRERKEERQRQRKGQRED